MRLHVALRRGDIDDGLSVDCHHLLNVDHASFQCCKGSVQVFESQCQIFGAMVKPQVDSRVPLNKLMYGISKRFVAFLQILNGLVIEADLLLSSPHLMLDLHKVTRDAARLVLDGQEASDPILNPVTKVLLGFLLFEEELITLSFSAPSPFMSVTSGCSSRSGTSGCPWQPP